MPWFLSFYFGIACSIVGAQTQRHPLEPPIAAQTNTPQHRTRLILKDGSFQTVLDYKVVGKRVLYRSAERNGEQEELPLSLVDLPATEAWQRAHDDTNTAEQPSVPVLSPELAREEALRAAQTPEVASDLHLPESGSVVVLDTYRGTPELVPLPQSGSELNRETAHDVDRKPINPAASAHDLLLLKEERADVQLHVADPVFYVRLRQAEGEAGGSTFVVETGDLNSKEPRPENPAESTYLLERLDVRQGARAISSVRMTPSGIGKGQADVIELRSEPLAGGYWLKLTPFEPLSFGEYALVEVLGERSVNADVWPFGVHPTAKENDEALRPEPKRPARLEHRRPSP